jgi:hypothetical protein
MSDSLISNQPIGARTGLFTPTNAPVGATITAPPWLTSQWWQRLLVPNSGFDLGLGYGTPPPAAPRVQYPLNQANPNFTAGIPGAVGTQSGPPVHATYDMPPAPDVATAARTYRAAHGLATPDDAAITDALNAESLAAARAGRTYLDPALAAQYAQPLPAGVSGPRTDIVNALAMPPSRGTPPIMLAPTVAVPSQQPADTNPLLQGLY